MERQQGKRRDIEVVRAVREAVGPACSYMADPNNGYRNDREAAWRLLSERRQPSHWIEEIFPENVVDYTWPERPDGKSRIRHSSRRRKRRPGRRVRALSKAAPPD